MMHDDCTTHWFVSIHKVKFGNIHSTIVTILVFQTFCLFTRHTKVVFHFLNLNGLCLLNFKYSSIILNTNSPNYLNYYKIATAKRNSSPSKGKRNTPKLPLSLPVNAEQLLTLAQTASSAKETAKGRRDSEDVQQNALIRNILVGRPAGRGAPTGRSLISTWFFILWVFRIICNCEFVQIINSIH